MNKTSPAGLDLYTIENSLLAGGFESIFEPYNKLEWLKNSYHDPEKFWTNLLITKNSFFSWSVKSIPFKKYDFYHDIIVCNRPGNTPALRWFDLFSGWQKISYSDIEIQAVKTASAWKSAGITSGQTICIIYPFGKDFIISLVAALKLGLIISQILPQGRSYLQKRLEMLNPEHIATDSTYVSMIPQWKDRIFNTRTLKKYQESAKISADIDQSHSYNSGDVVFRCFDPSSQTPHIPVDVNADLAYLCPVRDALIGMGLGPGDAYAAPGFHFAETQPALILSGLLTGASFLYLEQKQVFDNPEILLSCSLKAIGISQKTRDALIQNPIKSKIEPKDVWKFWFRNPAESSDMDKWYLFVHRLKLDNTLTGNLKWDACSGGCSMFSIKHAGIPNVNILPSAGVKWGLADIVNTDLDALGEYGVLYVKPLGKSDKKNIILANMIKKNQDQWIFAGYNVLGKSGQHYPLAEVLEVLDNKIQGICCTIVHVPDYEIPVFDLIIFTGIEKNLDKPGLINNIHNVIEKELGMEFMPDRIKFFSYYPRHDENRVIEHEWCRSQYLTGGLYQKSNSEIHQCIAIIRELIHN